MDIINRFYTSLKPKSKMKPNSYSPIDIVIDKNNYNNNKIYLYKKEFNLNLGVKILSTHFGFIIRDNTNKIEKEYKTQCEISGIVQDEGGIKIFEKGKFNPWEFDLCGNLVESATFDYYQKSEIPVESDIMVKQYKM